MLDNMQAGRDYHELKEMNGGACAARMIAKLRGYQFQALVGLVRRGRPRAKHQMQEAA